MTAELRIPDAQLDFDADLLYTYDGQPFTGIGFEDEPGGGRSEVSYRSGLQHGTSRDWYPSGQLKAESSYYENVLHGVARQLDEVGNVLVEAVYEYGILVTSVQRDPAGNIVKESRLDPSSANFALLERFRREQAWPE